MAQIIKNKRSPLPRPYSPFDGFFRNSFPDMWNPEFIATVPSVNIKETAADFRVEMAVPGMKKEDFNIEVNDDIMTISCEKESDVKEDGDDNFSKREYNYSHFSRSFSLPKTVNTDSINARYTDGMLQVTIPKKTGSETNSRPKIKVE